MDDPDKTYDVLVLPLHVEEVKVEKRLLARVVQVRSETHVQDVAVEESLLSNSVVVERVAFDRYVDAAPPVRQEGDVTIVPVVEEVIVVERRLRLKEEVHIRTVQQLSTHRETVRVREQRAVVTRSEPMPLPDTPTPQSPSRPHHLSPARSHTMSETIVAVYDTATHAEQAVTDLLAANVPQSSIHRHAAEGSYPAGTTTPTARAPEQQGFWSSLFGGDAGSDHAVYDRTLESGGNVVTVTAVPEHDYQAVLDILERYNPVDLDERGAQYGLSQGMDAAAGTSAGAVGLAAGGTETPGTGAAASAGPAPVARLQTGDESSRIQLAEESLAVGKRVVNRGGTRIRRYVVETPVEESVSLHSERVILDRHPVTDGSPVTDANFTDKTIEMTETAEEAVVSKTARVVEEVSLRKEAIDRTETVRDTLRKEEVEIEQIPGQETTTTTTGATLNPAKPRV